MAHCRREVLRSTEAHTCSGISLLVRLSTPIGSLMFISFVVPTVSPPEAL